MGQEQKWTAQALQNRNTEGSYCATSPLHHRSTIAAVCAVLSWLIITTSQIIHGTKITKYIVIPRVDSEIIYIHTKYIYMAEAVIINAINAAGTI